LIPNNAVLPIIQGPLKGFRWVKGAGNNGHWLGTYEKEKALFFSKLVQKGDVVFDVGAHTGYYTLLVSRLVGSKGKVYSFEPVARNIEYLKKHIKLNNCNNIEIIKAAITNHSGMVYFDDTRGFYTGRISEGQNSIKTRVRALKLDDFVKKHQPPSIIKEEGKTRKFSTKQESGPQLMK
jgi:FkbM family methyltransferase